MKKPIKTISHIHVWDKTNKGDLAIVLAVQESLRRHFPGVKINDFPVESIKYYDPSTLAAINKGDIVIFGGGGLFYRYFLPYDKKAIRAITSPLFIFGVGYIQEIGAPALNKEELSSLLALVRRAKLVAVRDIYTFDFLLKNKITAKKIRLIGDSAALLSEQAPASFKPLDQIKIGLNLNYSGWLGFGQWREDILAAYRELADYFIDKHNAKIYYLQHHPGEKNIYPELAIKKMTLINLPPRQQKYVYGQLDLVIGMMLHSSVMSFGALTPEINVAYDLRNYSFAKFINCPELVVDLDKLKKGDLLKKAKMVFAKRDYYIRKFQRKRAEIRKSQENFLEETKKLLK